MHLQKLAYMSGYWQMILTAGLLRHQTWKQHDIFRMTAQKKDALCLFQLPHGPKLGHLSGPFSSCVEQEEDG